MFTKFLYYSTQPLFSKFQQSLLQISFILYSTAYFTVLFRKAFGKTNNNYVTEPKHNIMFTFPCQLDGAICVELSEDIRSFPENDSDV